MPAPLSEKAEEVKKEVAKIIPEYQKTTASSRTPDKPIIPQVAQKPPLEGSQSLKEALAQALGKKPQNEPSSKAQGKPVHAVDLKATLNTVAPKAGAAAKLPEDELRSMLAVDESLDNERP
jgi:hypothetical protein